MSKKILILTAKHNPKIKTLQKIIESLNHAEIETETANFQDDIEILMEKGSINFLINSKPLSDYKDHLIFIRTIKHYGFISYILSQLAIKEGIQVIDEQHQYMAHFGKLHQMFYLAKEDMLIPKTYFAPTYSEKHIENAINYLQLPIVIKEFEVDRGEGVYLAKTEEELRLLLKDLEETEVLFQEFIPNDYDYRLLVLGGKTVVVEKRIRTDKNEFRNNISVGGIEEFVSLDSIPKEMAALAQEAARHNHLQIAGVDFIIDKDNNFYILEVNRAPQFTPDKSVSNEIPELTNYLVNLCQKK